jgi:hypothetical protein
MARKKPQCRKEFNPGVPCILHENHKGYCKRKPVTVEEIKILLKKGGEDARELDKSIRKIFEYPDWYNTRRYR